MQNRSDNHAIVIGGSLAGLLSARVLSDHFSKVTLIEKQEQYQRRKRARQSITREQLTNARHAYEIAQARLQGAEADLALAQWELEHTQVIAPVDGHVTNVQIHRGSYARGGHAALALVDANSYWISAHFKETSLKKIQV